MSTRDRAPWRRMVNAFVGSPTGVLSGLAIFVLLVLVVLGPGGFGAGATVVDVARASEGPGAGHLLGTDGLGRDILSRTLAATRTSILLSLLAVALAMVAGSLLGGLLAAAGPRVRRVGATIIDTLMSFGDILLAVVVVAIVGVGAKGAVIAVAVAFTPSFARFTYVLVSSVVVRDYLAAARVTGVRPRGILSRYVARNVSDSMAIMGFTAVGESVIAMSSLSFLGLGIQSPKFDWGLMLTDGVRNFYLNPYAAVAPAVMITLTGLVLSLFGDALARAVNPILWDERPRLFRLRRRRAALPTIGESVIAAPPVEPSRDEDALDTPPLLEVQDLVVTVAGSGATPVNGVSFSVLPGEIVGIVGESGSGKSLTSLAISGLLPRNVTADAIRLRFAGHDLLQESDRELAGLLGTDMAMVFQDPMASLNPARKIGTQMIEAVRRHRGLSKRAARALAVRSLNDVRMTSPELRLKQHPYELSGGMRQRTMIAMGLMSEPRLIVADEPTTALDVTVQAQVMELMCDLNDRHGSAILLISHNISLLSEVCDRLIVMYRGQVVEDLSVGELLAGPQHPYTQALIKAVPNLTTDRSRDLETISDGAFDDPTPEPADA